VITSVSSSMLAGLMSTMSGAASQGAWRSLAPAPLPRGVSSRCPPATSPGSPRPAQTGRSRESRTVPGRIAALSLDQPAPARGKPTSIASIARPETAAPAPRSPSAPHETWLCPPVPAQRKRVLLRCLGTVSNRAENNNRGKQNPDHGNQQKTTPALGCLPKDV